jgi:ABC-type Fe3+/spermidine/putrescine transport system ATPase subunit
MSHETGTPLSNKPIFLEIENLSKWYGPVKVIDDLSMVAYRGEFLTLLGPSGCGKTTTLRCVAGFESPDRGRITLDGAPVCNAETGLDLAPERRQFGMVFQSYAVWPHMTVAENVAYGLRNRGLSKAEIAERVEKVLHRVGLSEMPGKGVTRLSGGQQQRVALARAIVYQPKILLFDEPLSNLDAKLRERMRLELRRLQTDLGITSIYVTHDQEEAMVMSDRVIVMNQGRIQQIGKPTEIYDRPANRFVADFIGSSNILSGTVRSATGGGTIVALDDAPAELICSAPRTVAAGMKVSVCFRPENAELARQASRDSVNNFPVTVTRRINMGSYLDYRALIGSREVTVNASRGTDIPEQSSAYLRIDPAHCLCLLD